MEKISVLQDPIHKHFRHPIYCVLAANNVRTIGDMIYVNDNVLRSIRNFGTGAMEKLNKFRTSTYSM